jgi:glutathione S-transferase
MSAALKLYVLGSGWGVPFVTAAPFPLKLVTWLRMAQLPHSVIVENDLRKAPKKKSPWIEEGSLRMGDTELVISHLKTKHGVDPDRQLSPADRALATAWHRTFEEHYHQAFEHQLFFGRGGTSRLGVMFGDVPGVVRPIVRRLVTSALRRQLHARGLGRHEPDLIVAMGKADLDAASEFLSSKPFFLGDQPHTIDACAFGFLAASVYVEGDNPLFRHAASLPNLVAFVERMRSRFFPETR